MKVGILSFLILSSFVFNLSAQPYQSIFSDDTTRWLHYECIMDGNEFYTSNVYDDTIINSESYKIIDTRYRCAPDYKTITGFLREDTIEGEVWYLPNFENVEGKEFLIMDLKLEKGDRFHFVKNTFNLDKDSEDLFVDTVFFMDGRKIIQLNAPIIGCWVSNLFFVEGIGPSNGITYMLGSTADNILLLKHHGSKLVYTSSVFDDFWNDRDCFVSVSETELNTFFDLVSINGLEVNLEIYESKSTISLVIYDFLGNIIQKKRLIKGNNLICLERHGYHILKIINGNKTAILKLKL